MPGIIFFAGSNVFELAIYYGIVVELYFRIPA